MASAGSPRSSDGVGIDFALGVLIVGAGILAALALALVVRAGRRASGRSSGGRSRNAPAGATSLDPWREAGRRHQVPDPDADADEEDD